MKNLANKDAQTNEWLMEDAMHAIGPAIANVASNIYANYAENCRSVEIEPKPFSQVRWTIYRKIEESAVNMHSRLKGEG